MQYLKFDTYNVEPLLFSTNFGVILFVNNPARVALEQRRGIYLGRQDRLCFSRTEDGDRFETILRDVTSGEIRQAVMRFAVGGEPDPNTVVAAPATVVLVTESSAG